MEGRPRRRFDLTAVLVAFIYTIPPTAASIAAIVISLYTKQEVKEVKAVAVETQEKVEVVHKATNSLTAQLVQTTRDNALQEGHTKGVKDQKGTEAKEKKKNDLPLPFWRR